jgi:uncharacterized protein YndB with AHSA1/START domain
MGILLTKIMKTHYPIRRGGNARFHPGSLAAPGRAPSPFARLVIICAFGTTPAHTNHNKGDTMIKKIAIGLAVIVLAIAGLALSKPDRFSMQRSIVINAPPEKIMPLIADFHNWVQWSPWEHLDPNMVRTFSGPASGKGAIYGWKGNDDVGQGRMEITEYTAPTRAVTRLDFIDPIESNNVTEFNLTPQAGGTLVTWTMTGPMPFLMKVMSVFKNMDAMVGPDFEKGLAKLKTVAEK